MLLFLVAVLLALLLFRVAANVRAKYLSFSIVSFHVAFVAVRALEKTRNKSDEELLEVFVDNFLII